MWKIFIMEPKWENPIIKKVCLKTRRYATKFIECDKCERSCCRNSKSTITNDVNDFKLHYAKMKTQNIKIYFIEAFSIVFVDTT